MKGNAHTIEELFEGLRAGNKVLIGQAITLIESTREQDYEPAQQLIEWCLPHSGNSLRLGITGVPGAGKSTFIEALGQLIVSEHKIAVMAIDPSSKKTRGSILGDKTRMQTLSTHPNAFVRPSPAGLTLGGTAAKTKETILLLEAAGYPYILVETVGVGQSETAVADMVDIFLLLMITGAGDELQGIKKGILEMSDIVVINKADGDNTKKARMVKTQLAQALHLMQAPDSGMERQVMTCSALHHQGIEAVWNEVKRMAEAAVASGYRQKKRSAQNVRWLHTFLEDQLKHLFLQKPGIKEQLAAIAKQVEAGELSPYKGARQLLHDLF